MLNFAFTIAYLCICGLFPILTNAQYETLSTYSIDSSKITVSGGSSGAAMSTQFHVVYSKTISGSANIAGGPYWCSQGSILLSTSQCMLGTVPIIMSTLYNKVTEYARKGLIDDPVNLKNDRVYIFSGMLDTVVSILVVRKVDEFFSNYMPGNHIKTVYNIPAVHAMITDNYGWACGVMSPYFINNCGYNMAFEILWQMYPNDAIVKPSWDALQTGKVIRFDQREFFPAGSSGRISMEDYGFLYVPNGCMRNETVCKLHVVFHGCLQSPKQIGDILVQNAGYNQVADLNNIIVLYPQTKPSLLNSNACWDWWGYTNDDFANNKGFQMDAVFRMIKRLASL